MTRLGKIWMQLEEKKAEASRTTNLSGQLIVVSMDLEKGTF